MEKRKHKVKKTCQICGKEFFICPSWEKKGRGKFCSEQCYGKYRKQKFQKEKHPRWKGGRTIDKDGYVYLKSYTHPHKNNKSYYPEHRLMMERHLGRVLLLTEIVHHINGEEGDNRIENLMLFSSTAEHTKYHANKAKKATR